VGVGVFVGVAVRVGVAVGVLVGMGVSVLVSVGVGVPPETISSTNTSSMYHLMSSYTLFLKWLLRRP
jgi:hypothetical protein